MADPLRVEEIALRDRRRVTLRPANFDDVESVLENINLVCKEEVYILPDEIPYDLEAERKWLSAFDGKRNVLFVAADGRRIVGQADCHGGTFSKNRHTGLLGIVIRDGWRGTGLGRALMDRLLEWMRSQGFLKAYLEVFSTNVRARKLYESLGFQVEGIHRAQFKIRGDYVDDVLMGLWLPEGRPVSQASETERRRVNGRAP